MRTGIGGIALAGSSTHFAVPRTEAESSRELAICNGQKLYLSHHRRSLPTDRRLSQPQGGRLSRQTPEFGFAGGRKNPRDHELRPVSPRQFRLPSLPTKQRQFMAQYQNLELIRATRPPQQHRSANTFRTARYANDQSKQPSLDHDSKSPNLAKWPCSGRQDEVCEPYGFTC